MTGVGIALVLLSALLHATWNFLNKGSDDRWAFFLGQGIGTFVLYAPAFLWYWPTIHIDRLGWVWIAASAVTHAGYAVFLLKSYDAGDLSVAYPLSRTAPMLVAVWDMFTVRGQLTGGGVVGTLLAGAGALILQLPALRSRGSRAVLGDRVTRYALTTALFITLYTIIDKQGVGHVHPFIYLYLTAIGELAIIAWMLRRDGVRRTVREFRANTRPVLVTAAVGPFSYLLILWVLTTTPASYVVGLRQTSIVFGVLLGRIFLGEGETAYRLTGAGVIAAGSVLIALAG